MPADEANEYAGWFRALGDGTRIQILNVVSCADGPMTVGEVVRAVGKSQSTVSQHLQILADECFVYCEPDGVRTLVSANEACMTELPRAAAHIMGVSK